MSRVDSGSDSPEEDEILRALNHAKSQFIANVSHEMRTPLGVVMGFTDLAMGLAEKDSEQMNYLCRVKRSSEILFDLINDFLDLSRIESKNLLVERQQVDFHSLIQDLVEDRALVARENNVRLDLQLSPDVPKYLITDPTRLTQILQNLIKHSFRYTKNGTVKVSIRKVTSATGMQLEIRVQDIGFSLSEEEKSKFFQVFHATELAPGTRSECSSLGLALSKGLAKALGGDLTVETSDSGSDNVFLLSLSIDAVAPGSFPSDHSQSVPLLKGSTVLLVEDSLDNQILVSRFLRAAGAQVDVAINGQIAIEKALAHTYSLILMDLQMPVLSGHQAVAQLREKGVRTPIVALTAHAFHGEKEAALEAGFTDFLTKPIGSQQLINALGEVLAQSASLECFKGLRALSH